MNRKIVTIDASRCNGCGLCVEACHEGALQMIDGKARLVSDSYCDGLGDCLPECPTGAITIEEREAAAFDAAAVAAAGCHVPFSGCPGSQTRTLRPSRQDETASGCACHAAPAAKSATRNHPVPDPAVPTSELDGPTSELAVPVSELVGPTSELAVPVSELAQWPCQIKLVPVNAPWLKGARLLVAADCAAFAAASFHADYMKGRITLIGCPKLDGVDYAEKLGAILRANDIRSVLVVRMEVPCCGGLERAVTDALLSSGKMIPWQVVTLATDGQVLED